MLYHIVFVIKCKFDISSRDPDISVRCESQCETEYINCTSGCSESNCLMECGRAFSGCVDGKYWYMHKFSSPFIFKIVHAMRIVLMVVPIVQIPFAFVERILHLKTKKIWKAVKTRGALTLDSASLIAKMIEFVRILVLTISK